jgi:hypothetical protein
MNAIDVVREELIDEIETGFVHAQLDVSQTLFHTNNTYSNLCAENCTLAADYPKINKVLQGSGKIKLKPKTHTALQKFIDNQFWIDMEERSELYFCGFRDCLEFLKCVGAIRKSFIDLDISDAKDERQLDLKDVFCDE